MATTVSRRWRQLIICTLVAAIADKIVPPVCAHAENSPVLTNWFRRVSTTSSDGSWLWGWAWGADNTVSVVDRSPPVSFVSRPASFGRVIEDAVNGYGIPMNAFTVDCGDGERKDQNPLWNLEPNFGCPRLCPSGKHMPEPEESWIAIVQRGNCSFVAKVREAQRFGAKAVIVGGDDPAIGGNPDVLVNMYSQSDSSDVKIPSTYIKFSDYAHLSNLIASSNTSTSGIKTVSLQITADYASWEWYSPILTFIILLLLPSALTLTTLLIHRIRAARAEQRERAPEDVVNRLPWRVWTGSGWEKHEGPVPSAKSSADTDLERGDLDAMLEGDQGQCPPSTSRDDEAADSESVNPPWFDAQTECAICLNDFVKGDRVRVLPCKHIFHVDEVDEWLIHRKKLCPVCKADVTQPSHPYHHLDLPAEPEDSESGSPITPTERTPLLAQHRLSTSTEHSDTSHTRTPTSLHPHPTPTVIPIPTPTPLPDDERT